MLTRLLILHSAQEHVLTTVAWHAWGGRGRSCDLGRVRGRRRTCRSAIIWRVMYTQLISFNISLDLYSQETSFSEVRLAREGCVLGSSCVRCGISFRYRAGLCSSFPSLTSLSDVLRDYRPSQSFRASLEAKVVPRLISAAFESCVHRILSDLSDLKKNQITRLLETSHTSCLYGLAPYKGRTDSHQFSSFLSTTAGALAGSLAPSPLGLPIPI
ncbi:hypothetical protein F5Y17DRAFT_220652 [Xylariaceae sp. FL0594]|nr:hypothetical protein F5Y17DRAFT_220652 [Xylariaceae sp. FL0594]